MPITLSPPGFKTSSAPQCHVIPHSDIKYFLTLLTPTKNYYLQVAVSTSPLFLFIHSNAWCVQLWPKYFSVSILVFSTFCHFALPSAEILYTKKCLTLIPVQTTLCTSYHFLQTVQPHRSPHPHTLNSHLCTEQFKPIITQRLQHSMAGVSSSALCYRSIETGFGWSTVINSIKFTVEVAFKRRAMCAHGGCTHYVTRKIG